VVIDDDELIRDGPLKLIQLVGWVDQRDAVVGIPVSPAYSLTELLLTARGSATMGDNQK
jgi:hypothetical protein